MTSQLKKNISNYISITDFELNQFCNLFTKKTIKKKEFILQQGEVCRFEAYINKGLFSVYRVDENGQNKVLYFALEDWWITDIDSFINQTTSHLYIQALEKSEVLFISKENKEFAYENFPFVEKLFRKMTQKTHVALQNRMIETLSKTADERYLDFLLKYPSLSQRLTNIQIAAYLGVTHEFLSRIKKKVNT